MSLLRTKQLMIWVWKIRKLFHGQIENCWRQSFAWPKASLSRVASCKVYLAGDLSAWLMLRMKSSNSPRYRDTQSKSRQIRPNGLKNLQIQTEPQTWTTVPIIIATISPKAPKSLQQSAEAHTHQHWHSSKSKQAGKHRQRQEVRPPMPSRPVPSTPTHTRLGTWSYIPNGTYHFLFECMNDVPRKPAIQQTLPGREPFQCHLHRP